VREREGGRKKEGGEGREGDWKERKEGRNVMMLLRKKFKPPVGIKPFV